MANKSCLLSCGAIFSLASCTLILAQSLQPSTELGRSGFAGAPREVIASILPELTSADAAAHPPIQRPMDGLTDAEYRAKKAAAAQGTHPAPGWAVPAGGPSVLTYTATATKNFLGIGEQGIIPSDMGLAVGPSFILQAVNVSFTVMDKNGVTQPGFPKALNTFFGLPNDAYTTDPRALYDWVNNRYVLIMLYETDRSSSSNQGFLLLAVSQTSDPRGAWWNYGPVFQIGAAGECPDYPGLGQDHTNWTNSAKGAIYVNINQFGGTTNPCGTGQFIQNYVLLLPKSPIFSGLGFSYWFQSGLLARGVLVDTLQPVNVMNKADRPRAEFMVNTFNIRSGGGFCFNGCNGLVVWAISNPFGFISGGPSPEFSRVVVATPHNYFFPTAADEPGCSGCIETFDTRISGTTNYSAGSIFGAYETKDPFFNTGENSPVWFEVHPILNDNDARCTGSFLNACPQITAANLRQEGCFVCGGWANHGSAYFGTLQSDPENNLTMVFNFSSMTTFPGTAYTSRRVTYGDNLMHDRGIFLRSGLAFYNQFRWGDYTGTAPDLAIPNSPFMWFSGMFSDLTGAWATGIGRDGFTTPSVP